MNYGECLSIRVNLVLKSYYESLLFNGGVKQGEVLSLNDQYQHKYNSFDNI